MLKGNTESQIIKVSTEPKNKNNKEIYADSQLVYLWELNHEPDLKESLHTGVRRWD